MSKPSLNKFEGAGNSFVLIDDRKSCFRVADAAGLCTSEMTDGLILLQLDPIADFRMRIFNRDGSEAESCGNGLRCLIRFIEELGYPRKKYRIAADQRIVEGESVGEQVSIEMGAPKDLRMGLAIDGWTVHSVDTGVPHAVVFVDELEEIDLAWAGPRIRHHSLFAPRGANVDFASLLPDGSLGVRTFERGIEGEVLSCGTGACAVAFVAMQLGLIKNPVRLSFKGGTMMVRWEEPRLYLIGPVMQKR